MKVGITISDFSGKKPGELLTSAKQFGIKFVEFNPTVFQDIHSVIENIDGIATGFHLPIVGEHGYDFSCFDAKEKIDDIIYLLNRHRSDLNLTYCVAHPPESLQKDHPEDAALEFLLENLQRLEVPIIIENIETWSEGDFDRLIDLAREYLKKQFIGLCFDPAHAYLRRDDIFSRFDSIASMVRCIHLSDCVKGEDAHLPFGRGELPIKKILKHVAKYKYDGVINLEVVPQSPDDIRAVFLSYIQVLRVFQKAKYFSTIISSLFRKI